MPHLPGQIYQALELPAGLAHDQDVVIGLERDIGYSTGAELRQRPAAVGPGSHPVAGVERHPDAGGESARISALSSAGDLGLPQIGILGYAVCQEHEVPHRHALAIGDPARLLDRADHGDVSAGQEGGAREHPDFVLVLQDQVLRDLSSGIGEGRP
jgi:hypothetical protein